MQQQIKQPRIPFLLLQPKRGFSHKMHNIASNLLLLVPNVRLELTQLFESFDPEDYVAASIWSAAMVGGFLGFMFFSLTLVTENISIFFAFGMAALAFAAALAFYIYYPTIMLRKIAQMTDNELVFALRELSLQIESGVTLYNAMLNVAQGNYGYASRAFSVTVRDINNGVPEKKALERMALRSRSEYMKKIVWQLLTALDSGAPLNDTLKKIVDNLMVDRRQIVKDFSASLSFLVLMYMLVAAAIPSIGMTFLILLSTFSGIGLGEEAYLVILFGTFLGQIGLIGYINSTRPAV
ncbi:MAG: type II secretion system F family protein [Candidatus Micrarchaeia archaeon]|jgi:flagellar protein FlaJ